MRRLFLLLLLALALGVMLSLGIAYDTGYVRVSFGHYLLETNVWVGLALLLILTLAVHWLLRLVMGLRLTPGSLRRWASDSARKRSQRRTNRGLLHLAEGNWGRARKLLVGAAAHSETPLINYLSAAEAAHELGDDQEAEELLRKAHESSDDGSLAVGLTQVRLQLSSGRPEQALATLLRLRRKSPKHPHVLRQLMNAYIAVEDWRELSQLLPELHAEGVLPDHELSMLEQQVWLKMLDKAAEQVQRQPPERRNLDHLDRIWDELPTARRRDEAVVFSYANYLAAMGEQARAEVLLRKTLRHSWSDRLVNLYGRISGPNPEEQLITAENWLKERPNSAELLLTLGRLSLRNCLWGKAREYFEASLSLQRKQETLAELCRLCAHQGDLEKSAALLRQGALEGNALPELPMPRPRTDSS
ncbi:MAG: heme biosynthesis HemY N-terminal domain-containing protein [Oleiphilaceae bacterium]|nr:heme biosynthesis HemY N-terminal domain-containing protein [Oleiphilaceae bacterium]